MEHKKKEPKIEVVKPQPKGAGGGKRKKSLKLRLADAVTKRGSILGMVRSKIGDTYRQRSIESARKSAKERMKKMGTDSRRYRM
tara:strand:+ start:836 stop:1087 length:252 start_codon:yes stop_codon:yes gene_type:complete